MPSPRFLLNCRLLAHHLRFCPPVSRTRACSHNARPAARGSTARAASSITRPAPLGSTHKLIRSRTPLTCTKQSTEMVTATRAQKRRGPKAASSRSRSPEPPVPRRTLCIQCGKTKPPNEWAGKHCNRKKCGACSTGKVPDTEWSWWSKAAKSGLWTPLQHTDYDPKVSATRLFCSVPLTPTAKRNLSRRPGPPVHTALFK